ncbi:DUF3800 domain-containing protein [Bacteroides thetaiotaomicron]|jgi:hypothetical protein|uniref:Uncharacterized protein n=2 Tax=Bacteroides thetaiotaomicron TaxID=818 RepID=A0A174V4J2_BACT4|nr:DUF3800 domain-containing protein [Bacteroides thetaiotaomicron]MCS2649272.1 DUF3800 domain-containing protein [Bacteroides thetaiotaomicron]CUQ28456.1 Uncharacterised protein [Bacteroides thetaiotaomicron]
MNWHSPRRKNKRKRRNKKSVFSYKKKNRRQQKRKVYINKPKCKRKRDKIKVNSFASKKGKITIDYTSLRESSIMLYSYMNPNLDFDTDWIFYYDETNNFKKLHIKDRTDFNVKIENNFVLGGLCHDLSINIDESLIFSNIPLQKSAKEVKLKHIANGSFLEILKSTKLTVFMENIIKMPLYIHYQSLNPLYYSLVDIIDSNNKEKYIPYNRILKSTIYDVLKNNINNTMDIIKSYGYPNINKSDVRKFICDLINLTTIELRKSPFIEEKIKLNLLLDFLRDTEGIDELIFLSDEDECVLIKQLNEFYSQNAVLFINSKHIFDNESDVQNNFSKVKMLYQDREISNYLFSDSKSNILIQASDVIIGVFGKLFSFIKSIDILSLDDVISKMNDTQIKNLDLLLTLYNKSLDRNPSFINSIESDSELKKLNALNRIRGFA